MIASGTLTLPISDAVSARVDWEAEIRVLAPVMRDDPCDDRDVDVTRIDITLVDETSDGTIDLDEAGAKALGLRSRAQTAALNAAHETEIDE